MTAPLRHGQQGPRPQGRPATLRVLDPPSEPGWFRRGFAALATTRPVLFFTRRVCWRLDPVLLRLTGGRFCSTLIFPTQTLVTRGARTGAARRNAVIYFRDTDGDRVIIAPSNAGGPRHPDWSYNLRAHPDVIFAGRPMRASLVEGHELERLWRVGDRVFPAYATYRRRAATAGREIPLVALSPRPEPAGQANPGPGGTR